jgi:myo-inositol-1(or 4)-monophosphatase
MTARGLPALALRAARAGARAVRDALHSGRIDVRYKGGNQCDPVTAADHASEAAIRRVVVANRGADGWLGEESGSVPGTSGLRWVADPLDGTVNVSHGLRRYAVSVAVESEADGAVVAAAILCPANGEWLALGPGGVQGRVRRIGVSAAAPARALLAFAVPNEPTVRATAYRLLSDLAPRVQDLRNMGSTVCDLAAVAAGRLDGFVTINPQPWDVAAGVAIVHAAGGTSRRCHRSGLDLLVVGGSAVVDSVADWIGPEARSN